MRINNLILPLCFLFSCAAFTKEINIRYNDNQANFFFGENNIQASGYQLQIVLDKKKCNRVIFNSASKELNEIIDRVNSKMFHSKESIDNIVISTDKLKNEIISPRSSLGKRILNLKSLLNKLHFEQNILCESNKK